MPQLVTKAYYFSRKLVLFNETFAQPGKNKRAVCVLWHEGESGRKAYNIASAYINFLLKYCRDLKHVYFSVDNCNAQNKNKVFFFGTNQISERPFNNHRKDSHRILRAWSHIHGCRSSTCQHYK